MLTIPVGKSFVIKVRTQGYPRCDLKSLSNKPNKRRWSTGQERINKCQNWADRTVRETITLGLECRTGAVLVLDRELLKLRINKMVRLPVFKSQIFRVLQIPVKIPVWIPVKIPVKIPSKMPSKILSKVPFKIRLKIQSRTRSRILSKFQPKIRSKPKLRFQTKIRLKTQSKIN